MRGEVRASIINESKKGMHMKKILLLLLVLAPIALSACVSKCEVEPMVEQNHKLIVPPNFGQMPAGK